MTPDQLRKRTTAFAINTVLLCDSLWLKANGRNIADQLSRSATSVASNYRVASRARSRREFISRIAVAREEADESLGWLEVILGTKKAPEEHVRPLLTECEELVAILSASRTTAINRAREQDEAERRAKRAMRTTTSLNP